MLKVQVVFAGTDETIKIIQRAPPCLNFSYIGIRWRYTSLCERAFIDINRGSYMSAHVLLILLNELGKRDKMRGLPSISSLFFATSLINSIIQEHDC